MSGSGDRRDNKTNAPARDPRLPSSGWSQVLGDSSEKDIPRPTRQGSEDSEFDESTLPLAAEVLPSNDYETTESDDIGDDDIDAFLALEPSLAGSVDPTSLPSPPPLGGRLPDLDDMSTADMDDSVIGELLLDDPLGESEDEREPGGDSGIVPVFTGHHAAIDARVSSAPLPSVALQAADVGAEPLDSASGDEASLFGRPRPESDIGARTATGVLTPDDAVEAALAPSQSPFGTPDDQPPAASDQADATFAAIAEEAHAMGEVADSPSHDSQISESLVSPESASPPIGTGEAYAEDQPLLRPKPNANAEEVAPAQDPVLFVEGYDDEFAQTLDAPAEQSEAAAPDAESMPVSLGFGARETSEANLRATVPAGRVELPASEVRRRRETPFGIELTPQITSIPLEGGTPDGEFNWLNQFDLFRNEVSQLARAKRWERVAAVTAHAVLHAPYSAAGTRTGMLLDLARIYRDRLKDNSRAEEAFAAVLATEPENAEAIAYLEERYAERSDHRALFDMYLGAVEATWDPGDRLDWTRHAAGLATQQLHSLELATNAWEQLWRLGDGEDECARELATLYRSTSRWDALASFLEKRADVSTGARRHVLLRELAEVRRSGTRDLAGAAGALERLRAERPSDTVAVAQLIDLYGALERWDRLAGLADSSDPHAGIVRMRDVAEALWVADRHEDGAKIYRRLLQTDIDDEQAQSRSEMWLRESGRFDELVQMLRARAERAEEDDDKVALYGEAALVADAHLSKPGLAVEMLNARLALEGPTAETLSGLAGLQRRLGDHAALAETLEGRLLLEDDVEARIDLMRELASHAALKLNDSERSEAAWKRLLALSPADGGAFQALVGIYAERGDHEALVATLEAEMEQADTPNQAGALGRRVAEHLDQHFDDAPRALAAWQRVLDDAPDDDVALAALARHAESAGDVRSRISALERRIRIAGDPGVRITWAMEVASLWEGLEQPAKAAAVFERVLHWEPAHRDALEGLVRMLQLSERADLAVDVLDHAASGAEGGRKAALMRRALELVPEQQRVERFERLRRILQLTDDLAELDALEVEAEAGDLWSGFESVLTDRAGRLQGASRAALLDRLCGVLQTRLDASSRAYLVRQATLLRASDAAALTTLRSLAPETGRVEDLIAVLEQAAAESPDRRVALRAEVATLTETHLNDAKRTLESWRRVLALNAAHEEARTALGRVAEEGSLHAAHDAILGALELTKSSELDRKASALNRAARAADVLSNPRVVFTERLRAFRLDPTSEDARDALASEATGLGEWQMVLPAVEAASLSRLPEGDVEPLAAAAEATRAHGADPTDAFELYALALDAAPDDERFSSALIELATTDELRLALASHLRRAAARTEDPERRVSLLRRTACLWENELKRPEEAADIHMRILELAPDDVDSLAVSIARLRDRERWWELREQLQHAAVLADDASTSRAHWMEVASLSEEKIEDIPATLHAYGRVLEIDSDDSEARDKIEQLVSRLDDPELRLRYLRMETESADEKRRAQLDLEIATLQRERLIDIDAAVETMEASVATHGLGSLCFDPLIEALETLERWPRLASLLKEKADGISSKKRKLVLLRSAYEALDGRVSGHDETLVALRGSILSLNSKDRVLQRAHAQHLRENGDYAELLITLSALEAVARDDVERTELARERARLLALNLAQREDADAVWRAQYGANKEDSAARSALIRSARLAEDLDQYVALRTAELESSRPQHAALILCHLAEACDEAGQQTETIPALYREARRLFPTCAPAMEALKGIGRRKTDLRPGAALLPVQGEREMSWAARAERLQEQAEATSSLDPARILDTLLRSVSVDPDRVEGWDALAQTYDRSGDERDATWARLEAIEAVRRTVPISSERSAEEAERLLLVAQTCRTRGEEERFEELVRRVHAVAPMHVPTALAIAHRDMDAGHPDEVVASMGTLIAQYDDRLDGDQRADVHFARAAARNALGDDDGARADLYISLDASPLHRGALAVLADLEAKAERYNTAIPHQIRSLVAEVDAEARAQGFLRLGELWEDGVNAPEEAGACYEIAHDEGLESPALLQRMLGHYRRSGNLEAGLQVIDTLLQSAHQPTEMASLWVARGEIYAGHPGREEDAIEAFDMALSYDPDSGAARLALASLLERREDWQGALQIFEAIADETEGSERDALLVRMSRLAVFELDDASRAEVWLNEVVSRSTDREALELLADVVANREPGGEEHLALLSSVVAAGPPYYEPTMAIGNRVLNSNAELAWCLLAPALMVRSSDDGLKAKLRDMRRDFERPGIRVVAADALTLDDDLRPLEGVLAELEQTLTIGRATAGEVDENAAPISVHSNVGRTFQQVGEAAGVAGASLYRCDELEEPVMIACGEEGVDVLMRADVFQQLARAEIGFALTYSLFLARPGARGMASLAPSQRTSLIGGLFRALGLWKGKDAASRDFASRVEAVTDAPLRGRWAETLAGLADEEPRALSRRYWGACRSRALRAGLVAGPDLFQAVRLVARMAADADRPSVFNDCAALDEYVLANEEMLTLLVFATTPAFAALIRDTKEL
ncbi:MAG: tetratricopeptide (TPR) repeat protein [Bradymonadia bacterium]|jgi:tetratricopeptide (TPR) repeat protein